MTTAYSTVISPNDQMWKAGEAWYFETGLSALECIRRALNSANVTPTSILDLPCGHGRVCRMLRMAFPDAHISASDLDRDGVDFCAQEFEAEPLYSREDIREVRTSRSFESDLVWVALHSHRGRTVGCVPGVLCRTPLARRSACLYDAWPPSDSVHGRRFSRLWPESDRAAPSS